MKGGWVIGQLQCNMAPQGWLIVFRISPYGQLGDSQTAEKRDVTR